MAVLTIAFWASLMPAMAATTTPIPAAIGDMAPDRRERTDEADEGVPQH